MFCLTLSLQWKYILHVPVYVETCLAETPAILVEDTILQHVGFHSFYCRDILLSINEVMEFKCIFTMRVFCIFTFSYIYSHNSNFSSHYCISFLNFYSEYQHAYMTSGLFWCYRGDSSILQVSNGTHDLSLKTDWFLCFLSQRVASPPVEVRNQKPWLGMCSCYWPLLCLIFISKPFWFFSLVFPDSICLFPIPLRSL